jgi:hypothetical protein
MQSGDHRYRAPFPIPKKASGSGRNPEAKREKDRVSRRSECQGEGSARNNPIKPSEYCSIVLWNFFAAAALRRMQQRHWRNFENFWVIAFWLTMAIVLMTMIFPR